MPSYIKRELVINVEGDKASLNQPLYVFQNDRNIDIYMTINNFKFDFLYGMRQEDLLAETDAKFFSIKILKPNGVQVPPSQILPLVNDKVYFTITKDLIDELDEIGVYKLQVSLHDEYQGKVTIPYVTFGVLAPLFEGDIGINEEGYARVDISHVGCSVVAKEIIENELNSRIIETLDDEQYDYPLSKLMNWKFEELIISGKMNNTLQAIEELYSRYDELFGSADNTSGKLKAEHISYKNAKYGEITNLQEAMDEALDITNIKEAMEELLYIRPIVSSFKSNISLLQPLGTTIDSIIFTWKYNKEVILSQDIDGIPVENSLRTFVYTKPFNNTKTITLTGSDERFTCYSDLVFTFCNYVYWGSSSSLDYNQELIDGLYNILTTNRNRNISVTSNTNEYIYYCVPTRLSNGITFSVGGFVGGFQLVKTLTYTNENGYSENFNIYRSDNHSLGFTNVTVS